MSGMPLLKKAVVLLLLLGIAALGCAWFFLGPLVEAAVSHGGTRAAGVPVVLEDADVSLVAGTVHLAGLRVDNPPGYSERPFLALRDGSLKLLNSSIFSDAIQIETLDLSGVQVSLERGKQGANYDAILANLKRAEEATQPEPETGPARALHAKLVVVRDVRVTLELDGVPYVAGKKELVLPLIEIRDFKSDGSTSEVVGTLLSALVRAILDAALQQGAGWLPEDVLDGLGVDLRALRKALDEPDGLLPGLLEQGKQALPRLESLFDKK